MTKVGFEPKIVGFICSWCAYGDEEPEVMSAFSHSSRVRINRVMCSRIVKPQSVFKALIDGADGVLVVGRYPDHCHFSRNKYQNMRRYQVLKKVLEQLGVEAERVQLVWLSRSGDRSLTKTVADFTEQLRQLGPFKLDQKAVAG